MAFNDRMHPRNIYKKKKPNFKELASKYENFRKEVEVDGKERVKVDFKNPSHLKAVTWVLLKDDFDLDVTIPIDRLIPTVPLRLNYILWIEDLFNYKNLALLHGIDIGCGSTCIYSLLGAKKNSWKFLATEADPVNHKNALENVQGNNLGSLVKVTKVAASSTLGDIINDSSKFDFCMCNPPFFENCLDAWGISKSRSDSRPEPKSISTASELESIYPGGEVEFVKKVVIEPSLKLQSKIMIYTTMLGKKSSVKALMLALKGSGINKIATTEFCQGNTMRWGLAWTLHPDIKMIDSPKQSSASPLTLDLGKMDQSIQDIKLTVESILEGLKTEYSELETERFKCELISWSVTAHENTWIHQRKKRRKVERESCDVEPEAKKPRMESQMDKDDSSDRAFSPNSSATLDKNCSNDDSDSNRNFILRFDLNLTNTKSNKVLEFIYREGNSRELLHQVQQYFKNYFQKFKASLS